MEAARDRPSPRACGELAPGADRQAVHGAGRARHDARTMTARFGGFDGRVRGDAAYAINPKAPERHDHDGEHLRTRR